MTKNLPKGVDFGKMMGYNEVTINERSGKSGESYTKKKADWQTAHQ